MSALDDLVGLLDLEPLEVNLFRGVSLDPDRVRLYGGEVLAQALMAAGRTVDGERRVHSMHAYFLKLGDPKVPVVYEVDRIRDGRSFTTRRVVAIQHGTAIFNMAASFQVDEVGPDHHDDMPDGARTRDGAVDLGAARRRRRRTDRPAGLAARRRRVRHASRRRLLAAGWRPGRREARPRAWTRGSARAGRLPDDPLLHTCIVAYASDLTLLGTALLPHPMTDDAPGVHGRQPRPRDVVPPPVPCRRLAAVPHAQPVGRGRTRLRDRAGVLRRRHARGERRAGGLCVRSASVTRRR